MCDPCADASRDRELERARTAGRRNYAQNRERVLAANASWTAANPDKTRAIKQRSHEAAKADGRILRRALKRYGITEDAYLALLEAQGGVCAICGGVDPSRRLNIDHDHATGAVRGLLCNGCNGARLGRLGDCIERAEERASYYEERARLLRAAIDYLNSPPARQIVEEGSR